MAERVYWDSCVWIGLLNEESDKVDSARWVIERAEKGEIEIWTSTLTLAEVFKARCADGSKSTDPEADKRLDAFLTQPYIVHVQVDLDVGLEARRLLRSDLPALKKPNDAIHLASALWYSVDTLHTYDRDDLLPLTGKLPCRDGKLLAICKPPDRPPPPPKLPSLFDTLSDPAGANVAAPALNVAAAEPLLIETDLGLSGDAGSIPVPPTTDGGSSSGQDTGLNENAAPRQPG